MIKILEELVWKPVRIQVGAAEYQGTITDVMWNNNIVVLQRKYYPNPYDETNWKAVSYYIRISSIDMASVIPAPEDAEIIKASDLPK